HYITLSLFISSSTLFPTSHLFFSFFFLLLPPPPCSTLFPYTTLFRSMLLGMGVYPERDVLECRCGIVHSGRYLVLSTGSAHQARSEEHTSELQSRGHLVCRLLLEKKK